MLAYDHLGAVLYLLGPVDLQLLPDRHLDFLLVQRLRPDVVLQAVPVHLASHRGPHLRVVGRVFLLEFPVDDHQHLQNPYDQPVGDRLLRKKREVYLVLAQLGPGPGLPVLRGSNLSLLKVEPEEYEVHNGVDEENPKREVELALQKRFPHFHFLVHGGQNS